MPKTKRIKTSYTGVYYIFGNSKVTPKKKQKIYYIRYKINGKLIEEKAGCQYEDKMTPSHAARIRDQKIAGKLPLNRDQMKSREQQGLVDESSPKVDEPPKFEIYRESEITPHQLDKILNAIFHVSTDGLSISDKKGNIIACNEASAKITGLKVSDFLGKNVPSDVYRSTAYYEYPEAEMRQKEWLGADLVFDIDADHIITPCDKVHDKWICTTCNFEGKGITPEACPFCGNKKFSNKSWPCETCLDYSKRETKKLLDFLLTDFGFTNKEINDSSMLII